MIIKAHITIPPGYRLLRAKETQRDGDLQLSIEFGNGIPKGRTLGSWQPTMYVGYRADWGDNRVIRRVGRTSRR
jgi:hypothetical protein